MGNVKRGVVLWGKKGKDNGPGGEKECHTTGKKKRVMKRAKIEKRDGGRWPSTAGKEKIHLLNRRGRKKSTKGNQKNHQSKVGPFGHRAWGALQNKTRAGKAC